MTQEKDTAGGYPVARHWLETSSLQAHDRDALLGFISHFKSLEFYRETEADLNKIEKDQMVTLPRWLRDLRQTVAFVGPRRGYVTVQFVDSLNPLYDQDELLELWYSIGLQGYANDEDRTLLENAGRMKLFPIGHTSREMAGRSNLAIDLANHDDQSVYEYNLENLWDNQADHVPLELSVRRMFRSYSSMFQSIVAIKVVTDTATRVIDWEE